MNDLQEAIVDVLGGAARELRAAHLAGPATQMEDLARQVHEPCVVAVVGRVKAGKSTFINALLGEQNLALVGTTETTATINYFRYGQPHADRPVRCYWRNGQITDETRGFLESLQGYDLEALRRADGIDHLEYHRLNPYLEHVTLVDTPGTGAAVDEHQDRTADFLRLVSQLRERQHQESERLGSTADAVIYLFGATARVTDKSFLDEFRRATQGQALNAVGVMSKVDLQQEVLDQRATLCSQIAEQLEDCVNAVVPVSAGVRLALDRLLENDQAGLKRLMQALRPLPPALLKRLLAYERLFIADYQDCPLSAADRMALKGDLDWRVFATIAQVAADPGLDTADVRGRLEEIAGFGALRDMLERHLFKRGRLLRGYRILNDASTILQRVQYLELPKMRQKARGEQARRARFEAYLRQAGDDPVARELLTLVQEHFAAAEHPEPTFEAIANRLDELRSDLEEYNADFEALQQIQQGPADAANLFSEQEVDELRPLLGLYGVELEKRLRAEQRTPTYAGERQRHWLEISQWDTRPARRTVASRAVARYGLILRELRDSAADQHLAG